MGDTISLKLRPSRAPTRTLYIHHYEELHSHWDHVVKSLTACPRSYFREVVIDKIELSKTVMDMLGTALSTKRIDTLTLSYNNLDYTSLTTSYLENTPNVRYLKLVGNPLQDVTTALQFATAISNNEHMEKLEMKLCGLGGNRPTRRTLKGLLEYYCGLGGNDLLQVMLPYLGMLNSVNIGYNDITSNDVPCICSFIASNPHVKLLNLSFSEFNGSDAIKFVNALETNSNLQRMLLNGTEMTEKGKAMINAVVENRPKLSVPMKDASQIRGMDRPDVPNLLKYEYWRSCGYDMGASKSLVAFQNNLNGIGSGAYRDSSFLCYKGSDERRGLRGEFVDIGIDAYKVCEDQMYSHDPFIAYHASLLPKWRCALKELQINSSRNVNMVRIKRVQLVSNVVDLLGNAMSTKNIVQLTLARNRLDRQCYHSLSKFLEKKSPLVILELEENTIDDVACAQRFSEAVVAHPSLEKLVVDNCGLGSNTQILSAIASTMNRVSVLTLNWNEIGSDGAAVIGNVLSTNPASLKRLDVKFNEIDDGGVTPFAEALRSNTNLRDLYLTQNDITEVGESSLRKAAFDDTSLITLFNSNHTCKVHVRNNLCPETYAVRKKSVKTKMTVAMFGSDKITESTRTIPMNMHLFSDAPVELMPAELSFVNKCSKFGNKPCLSNMYEVVRTWNVPVMFSYAAGAVAPKEKKRRRKNGQNTTAKKAKSLSP